MYACIYIYIYIYVCIYIYNIYIHICRTSSQAAPASTIGRCTICILVHLYICFVYLNICTSVPMYLYIHTYTYRSEWVQRTPKGRRCDTLHHTAPHCTTLHHTTLHHTAPHCTTLHHTAPQVGAGPTRPQRPNTQGTQYDARDASCSWPVVCFVDTESNVPTVSAGEVVVCVCVFG